LKEWGLERTVAGHQESVAAGSFWASHLTVLAVAGAKVPSHVEATIR
jgi:hypothetical protein